MCRGGEGDGIIHVVNWSDSDERRNRSDRSGTDGLRLKLDYWKEFNDGLTLAVLWSPGIQTTRAEAGPMMLRTGACWQDLSFLLGGC